MVRINNPRRRAAQAGGAGGDALLASGLKIRASSQKTANPSAKNHRNRRTRPTIKAAAGAVAGGRHGSKAVRDLAAVEIGSGVRVGPRQTGASATKEDEGIDRPDRVVHGDLFATKRRRTGSNQLGLPTRPVAGKMARTDSSETGVRLVGRVALARGINYG